MFNHCVMGETRREEEAKGSVAGKDRRPPFLSLQPWEDNGSVGTRESSGVRASGECARNV